MEKYQRRRLRRYWQQNYQKVKTITDFDGIRKTFPFDRQNCKDKLFLAQSTFDIPIALCFVHESSFKGTISANSDANAFGENWCAIINFADYVLGGLLYKEPIRPSAPAQLAPRNPCQFLSTVLELAFLSHHVWPNLWNEDLQVEADTPRTLTAVIFVELMTLTIDDVNILAQHRCHRSFWSSVQWMHLCADGVT